MINQEVIEKHFAIILKEGLGLDLESDPNLVDTPKRVGKMYKEMFTGLYNEHNPITTFPNEDNYDEIVLLDNMFFVSMCSHHFLPFYGKGWVAYRPDKLLVGASKPSRLISHYAAKPSLQERVCHEVAEEFMRTVKPHGALVLLRAEHNCMKCRGVKQYSGAGMITNAVRGQFKDDPVAKAEALKLIELSIMA